MNILRHSIGDSEIVYHYIEPFDIDCFNCGALAEETFAVEFISILKWSKVSLTWAFIWILGLLSVKQIGNHEQPFRCLDNIQATILLY